MADTATTPPPALRYVVSEVKPIGGRLYQLTITLPDGAKVRIILSLSNLTTSNVYLSVQAVTMLYNTRDGARPVLHPIG